MTTPPDIPAIAVDLRFVVGRLARRFRADGPLPMPQLTALGRLTRDGAQTTSGLAALERVRPQSMAHAVAALEAGGLVARRPDPEDRRQTLIEPTDAGRVAMEAFQSAAESWLTETIVARLDVEEQQTLARGVELLRRVADA